MSERIGLDSGWLQDPKDLEIINQVLRIKEREHGPKKVIKLVQSFENVPLVGYVARLVADGLTNCLVRDRSRDLDARGVKPGVGSDPCAPIG